MPAHPPDPDPAAPTPALSPRAEAKRAQLREAARRLFLERGFSGTSTDAIAAAAGASKQTLYRHYPRKEVLLQDVLHHFFTSAMPAGLTDPLREGEALDTRLHSLMRSVVAHVMTPEYLALLRVIFSESGQHPELGVLFRQAVPAQGVRTIQTLLAQAQAAGLLPRRGPAPDLPAPDLPAPDLEAAARLLVGWMLTHALMDGLLSGGSEIRRPSEEQVAQAVRLVIRSVS